LTLTLVGGEWSASHSCRFTLRERAPDTHWIGHWVGPRAGLDDVERRTFLTLSELQLRPLDRPARSQSLYRLHLHLVPTVKNDCNYTFIKRLRLTEGCNANYLPLPFMPTGGNQTRVSYVSRLLFDNIFSNAYAIEPRLSIVLDDSDE
jgi:hypothetical protein